MKGKASSCGLGCYDPTKLNRGGRGLSLSMLHGICGPRESMLLD